MTQVFLAALALRILGTLHDILFGISFRVLCYHTISNPLRFAQHLAVLNRAAHVHGLSLLLSQRNLQFPISTKPRVLITFDDADPSVLDLAVPALKTYRFPSALFVVTNWIGSDIEPWWLTADRAWHQDPSLEIVGQRFVSSQAFVTRLKTLVNSERLTFLARLGSARRPTRNPTWSELSAALTQGMEIGAHSVTHPCLDKCSTDQVQHEVCASIASVREHMGLQQVSFALPNGNFNPDALHAAADAQANAVLLFDHRTMPTSKLDDDLPLISRLRIDDYASIWRFVFIASGWHSRIYHLIRRDTPARTLAQSGQL